VSYRLDDPGTRGGPADPRPPSTPGPGVDAAARVSTGRARAARTARAPNDLVYATRLPFDPGSPQTASYVEEHWSPAHLRFPGNRQAKAELYSALNYRPRNTQRDLSLSGGASIVPQGFSSWASSFCSRSWTGKNNEGDPLGSPSLELVCGQTARSHTSRRGLGNHRSGARRRPARARPTTRRWPLRQGTD
jgi:hypothetical protein